MSQRARLISCIIFFAHSAWRALIFREGPFMPCLLTPFSEANQVSIQTPFRARSVLGGVFSAALSSVEADIEVLFVPELMS